MKNFKQLNQAIKLGYIYLITGVLNIYTKADELAFNGAKRILQTSKIEFEWINCLINLCKDKLTINEFQKNVNKNLDCFPVIEFLIELLMKFLYTKRVATDKNGLSKFFDVTHIIFATQCDIFISGDKKLIKKAQLIYDFLKISTKIIYIEDIENDLFTKLNRILNSYKNQY